MSGVAGKSGRRPKTIDEKRHRTVDKAWRIADKLLENSDITLVEKAKVAMPMVVKSMIDVGEQTIKLGLTDKEKQEITRIQERVRGLNPIAPNELSKN